MTVFILSLLDYKSPNIAIKIKKDNEPQGDNLEIKLLKTLEEIYDLEEDNIRQIIKDVKIRIHSSQKTL